jgi:hypothetical protein
VKDRKFHTDKELKDNYPKPGVPVDEAWAEMNKMLGSAVQGPPKPGNGSGIPGVKKFFWQYTIAIAVVTVTMWGYYRKHSDIKTSAAKTTHASTNEIKQAQTFQSDTVQALNNTIEKHVDTSVAINDIVTKPDLPPINTKTQDINNNLKKDTTVILHTNNDHSLLAKSKVNKTVIHNAGSIANVTRNNTTKNNSTDINKRTLHKDSGKNVAGRSFLPPGEPTKNYDSGKDKRIMHSENTTVVQSMHHLVNLSNHNRAISTDKYLLSEIHTPMSSLPLGIISFIKEPINTGVPDYIRMDSAYLLKLRDAVHALALSKKHGIRSRGDETKSTQKKFATGFDYGLQWDAAIPVQGTTNYFRGTNGNSKPYNIILPQFWLSKGFNNNGKMVVKINLNQQYFAGNKQVSLDSISPPDSTFHRKYLSKTSGFGATLEYSYGIYKNWAASIGISYNLNRNALLNKQSINFYSGSFLSDSMYGIKRSSADWRYINKSLVLGNFELYCAFKKFSLGASVYVPITNIPVYGNKNIRPVNAQLFLRWNIEKD